MNYGIDDNKNKLLSFYYGLEEIPFYGEMKSNLKDICSAMLTTFPEYRMDLSQVYDYFFMKESWTSNISSTYYV